VPYLSEYEVGPLLFDVQTVGAVNEGRCMNNLATGSEVYFEHQPPRPRRYLDSPLERKVLRRYRFDGKWQTKQVYVYGLLPIPHFQF
jgi:hypothetical protein